MSADDDGKPPMAKTKEMMLFGRVMAGFSGTAAVITFLQLIIALVLNGDDSFGNEANASAAIRAYAGVCGLSIVITIVSFLLWRSKVTDRKGREVPLHTTYWGKILLLVVSAGPTMLTILLVGANDMTASVVGRLYSGYAGVRALLFLSILSLIVTVMQVAIAHVWAYVRQERDVKREKRDDSMRWPAHKSVVYTFQVVTVVAFSALFVATTVFLAFLYQSMVEATVGGAEIEDVASNASKLKPLIDTVKNLKMLNFFTMILSGLLLVVYCVYGCCIGIREKEVTGGGSVTLKTVRALVSTLILVASGVGYAYVLKSVSYADAVRSLANEQLLTAGSYARAGDALMVWQTLNFWSFFGYVVMIHVIAFTHDKV